MSLIRALSATYNMIESKFWKSDLLKYSNYLKKLGEIKKWTEKSQVIFEKKVVINFFIIRKLIETKKFSDLLSKKEYNLKCYLKSSKSLTKINSGWIDEMYKMEESKDIKKNILFICNQLIHSLTIYAQIDNNKWDNILMTSDYEKNKWLYRIDISVIIEIMEDFGNNYPSKESYVLNEAKNDYDLKLE